MFKVGNKVIVKKLINNSGNHRFVGKRGTISNVDLSIPKYPYWVCFFDYEYSAFSVEELKLDRCETKRIEGMIKSGS